MPAALVIPQPGLACWLLWRSVPRVIVFPLVIVTLEHWNKNPRLVSVLTVPPVAFRSCISLNNLLLFLLQLLLLLKKVDLISWLF